MTSRCWFITSSYWTTCLRMSKLWPSTLVCACSIAFETMPHSSGVSSSMPILPSRFGTHSGEKRFIRSSPNETKKRELPGSPWRPARPRSWLSMRRASCRSVPMMCRPPTSTTRSWSTCQTARASSRIAAATSSRRPLIRSTLALAGDLFGDAVRVATEDDVRATAGHVRGDRDGAEHAGQRDDVPLTFVLLGVEDGRLLQRADRVVRRRSPRGGRSEVRFSRSASISERLDRDRADEDRAAVCVRVLDLARRRRATCRPRVR